MRHSKAYLRHKTRVHIRRKRHILKDVYNMSNDEIKRNICFNHDGRLAKGKVHCSCSLCRAKTKELGWKHSDMKRIEACKQQEEIYKGAIYM